MNRTETVPGVELKIARIRAGKSQVEVAKEFGLTGEYISKLERNIRKSPQTRAKIYNYLTRSEGCHGGEMKSVS